MKIDHFGSRTGGYACNVGSYEEVMKIFGEIEQAHGKIDILVNNAGITRDSMFHKMSEGQWDAVIEVNLKSMFNCCQAVVAGMRNRKYGKIVNLASVSAFGNIGQTNYGASKGGVIGFTKCLAREVARNHVTVNCIAPLHQYGNATGRAGSDNAAFSGGDSYGAAGRTRRISRRRCVFVLG